MGWWSFANEFGERSSTQDIELGIRIPGSRMLPLSSRVSITNIWTTHGRKMCPTEFGVKMSKFKCTAHLSRNMLSGIYNVTLFTYKLPIRWGGERFLSNLRSKGQRSRSLYKVEVFFPGSRVLSFPLRDAISLIWTTFRRKVFPI
jgi:hypothetical protein